MESNNTALHACRVLEVHRLSQVVHNILPVSSIASAKWASAAVLTPRRCVIFSFVHDPYRLYQTPCSACSVT